MFQENSTVFTPTRLLMNDWGFNQDLSNGIGLFNPYPVKQPETVIPSNTQSRMFNPLPTTPPTSPSKLLPEPSRTQQQQQQQQDVEKKKERKKVLERNREAAYKCRQKKKQWLQNLENSYEIAEAKNKELTALVAQLREESIYLRNILLAHGNCDCTVVQAYLRRTSEQLAMSPPFLSSSGSETSLSSHNQRI